jgi:hypothetical protein
MFTPARRGLVTSEFWLTLLSLAYSAGLSTGVIPMSDQLVALVNAAAGLLVALGYTWARAFVKTRK